MVHKSEKAARTAKKELEKYSPGLETGGGWDEGVEEAV